MVETSVLQEGDLVDDRALESVEQDEFRAEDVVAEIAELARSVRTPANIVLFGAWGSGKSSVKNLLKLELAKPKPSNRKIKFATVDAFKFAEVPLRRSFITQVVGDLGLNKDDYRKKLYQRTSHIELKLDRAGATRLVVTFLASLILYGGLVAGLLGLAAWLGSGGWTHQFRVHIVAVTLSALAGSTVVTGLLTFVGETFTRDVSEDFPSSEEQFEEVFAEIVRERVNVEKNERLVIFIDELDRASSEQVAGVLETLRTFLELPGCVYVVAADQHVLERSLKESARQTTPPDPANPYYSSGSAYLDKIFQYQIQLPPVLPRRLWGFAQDLVERRDGLWKDLPDRREVVSVLIPTHVQSKRRVKSLLNNFALAYRLAEQREAVGQIADLKGRAAELAKLVCLRTEFPLFADDLLLDARMPALVLAIDRRDDLSAFPGASPLAARRARLYAEGKAPVDDVLVRIEAGPSVASEEREVDEVKKAHTQQLLRYLMRTESVPNPRRDLIFGDGAGSMFGLPSELTDVLETSALDGQTEQVVGELSRLDAELQRSSLLFLVRLLDEYNADVVSVQNIFSALLAASDNEDVSLDVPTADTIVRTLSSHGSVASLDDDQFDSALSLATSSSVGTPGRAALLEPLFASEAVRDSDLGFDLLKASDRLVSEFGEQLGRVFALRIIDEEAVDLSEAMGELDEVVASRVVAASHDTLRDEISAHQRAARAAASQSPPDTSTEQQERAEARGVADNLAAFLDIARDAGQLDVAVTTAKTLLRLNTPDARSAFEERLESLAPITDPDLADACLFATSFREIETWPGWLSAISDDAATKVRKLQERLNSLVKTFLDPKNVAPTTEGWQRDTVMQLGRLAKAGGVHLKTFTQLISARAEAAISDEIEATARMSEFELLRVAAESGAITEQESSDAIIDNLTVIVADEDSDALGGKLVLSDGLLSRGAASDETLKKFGAALGDSRWIEGGDQRRLILVVASELRRRDGSYPCPLDPDDVVELAGDRADSDAVRDWFMAFDPPVGDAWRVLTIWCPSRPEDRASVEDYVARQRLDDRTELAQAGLKAFVGGRISESTFALLHVRDADAVALASDLLTAYHDADSNPERDRVLKAWVALGSLPEANQRKLATHVFRPMLQLNKGAAEMALREASLLEGITGSLGRDPAREISDAGKRWGVERRVERALERSHLPKPRRARRHRDRSGDPPSSSEDLTPPLVGTSGEGSTDDPGDPGLGPE